jgi:hypothetical protein
MYFPKTAESGQRAGGTARASEIGNALRLCRFSQPLGRMDCGRLMVTVGKKA